MNQNEFLLSPARRRKSVLEEAEAVLKIRSQVIEKDIWVCWTLKHLFEKPEWNLVFKGGTSLSKVFNLIERYSEDIDITIDTHEKFPRIDQPNNSQLRKQRQEIEKFVDMFIKEDVTPWLLSAADREFGTGHLSLEAIGNQSLRIKYPAATEGDPYIKESVLIEFGGRMSVEPNANNSVATYLSQFLDIGLPIADNISTLKAERTFLEKVTLIHDECHRDELKETPERLFRHWYDVKQMMEKPEGQRAIADRELLATVVEIKERLFSRESSKYSHCLEGQFLLIPSSEKLDQLREDFRKMNIAGMFFKEPESFENIIESISLLQEILNKT